MATIRAYACMCAKIGWRVNLSTTMPCSSFSIKHAEPEIVQPVRDVNVMMCVRCLSRLAFSSATFHYKSVWRCDCGATTSCDASHHSYLLLHFVTICDLCSYDFFLFEDPFIADCHADRARNMYEKWRRFSILSSWDQYTDTDCFFYSIWKLNTNGFFVNFVHCSGTTDSCLYFFFWAIYCLASRFCIHARGKINGKGRSKQRTEQIMRMEWRAPYALRRLP